MKSTDKTAPVMRLAASVLLLVFLLAAMLPMIASADDTCSLTVLPASRDSVFFDDLQTAKVFVDVYQVATVTMDGTGSFDLALTDSFSSLKITVKNRSDGEGTGPELSEVDDFGNMTADQSITSETWEKLAQDAAELIRSGTVTEKAATLSVGKAVENMSDKAEDMSTGLYLLIAHTDESDYWDEVAEKPADGTASTAKKWVSIVHSASKSYHYYPTLITLPYKNPVSEKITTDSPEPWITDVTAVLKPLLQELRGKIKIIKTLDKYIGPDPAQFVFEITGKGPDNKDLPSRIVSLQFTGTGTKESVEIELPVGSTVTVTEVYEGSRYVHTTPVIVGDITISAGQVAEASFENTHDDTNTGGYGIVNNYRLQPDNSGGLKWSEATQISDNTPVPEPAQ